MSLLDRIAGLLAPHGLAPRGGFHPAPADGVPGGPATVVMVGNVGAAGGDAMWRAFSRARGGGRDPLNDWTRAVVEPVARTAGAAALFPFDKPYLPFQRWAMRAEPVFQSPLGLLIHPEFGLWHAYRAALAFAGRIELPPRGDAASPCVSCAGKPCLNACPVGAFTQGRYDARACADYLDANEGSDCVARGCLARRACPVGANLAHQPAQARFHLDAFRRGVALTC